MLQSSCRYQVWNRKMLVLIHIWIAVSLYTLFHPTTHSFWQKIDDVTFQALNQTLSWGKGWQIFWALANHKIADWVEDIVILIFFWLYIRSGSKEEKTYRISQMLLMIFISAFVIFFVNKTLLRDNVDIIRLSPTLVTANSIKLSEHITWLKIKDGSNRSFPGDHATTALLFGLTFVFLGSKKLKTLAALYAIFLCLPRMILGAHWVTDVLIGSGAIVLFFLSWLYFTPLSHKLCSRIASIFNKQSIHTVEF